MNPIKKHRIKKARKQMPDSTAGLTDQEVLHLDRILDTLVETAYDLFVEPDLKNESNTIH